MGKKFSLSDEAKRKISESNRGRVISDKTKKKISDALKGKQHSQETKEKIRETITNLHRERGGQSETTKNKLRSANLGKKLTNETKKKIGQSKKGNVYGAKINEDDVRQIRSLYMSGDYTQKQLSQMFTLNVSTISEIVNFKSWKHIK